MRKATLGFLIILFFSLSAPPPSVLAQNYVERFEKGKIDWSNAVVEAFGIGTPPSNPLNMAQARAKAESQAFSEARRNLIEIIKRVKIDSKTLIKDRLEKDDLLFREVQRRLQSLSPVDISYPSDGSVKVTVAVLLTGDLADLILPETIRTINPIKQENRDPGKDRETFTGLVADCRGSKVVPSMIPRIVDEDGKEVYGAAYVSRDHVVERGMAGYARDLNGAGKDLRVGERPLIIKAVGAAETGQTDIVISNADAARIRSIASNLSLLQQCRVLILLD